MRKTGVGLQSVSNGFLKRSQNALFENGNTTDAKTALSRIAPRALVSLNSYGARGTAAAKMVKPH